MSGAAEPAKDFKSIFDFNYPGLDELDKGQGKEMGQEQIRGTSRKSDAEVRQEEEKKANIAMIPVVNRSIKPNSG